MSIKVADTLETSPQIPPEIRDVLLGLHKRIAELEKAHIELSERVQKNNEGVLRLKAK